MSASLKTLVATGVEEHETDDVGSYVVRWDKDSIDQQIIQHFR
jgi:hypothetical protein